ncbi:MAG: single-stranded-DNA-specific exonuclease RecJ, partial [Actinobacteria bacterium]|nr:single-stranded-DNA-specific exonuclease RecJ [Actinomycetota bacterium]
MEDSITNWLCIENKNIDENLFKNTAKNYSRILIQLLANRKINTEEQINSFLNPSLKLLKPPELMPNIEKALARLLKAIKKNENILIFGDYDTDGIISSVLMHNFLKKIGLAPEIYIPDRFEEGYDINLDFIKKLSKKKKYDLVICVFIF